jgi:hypothetical protein
MLPNHPQEPLFDNGVSCNECRREERDLGEVVLMGPYVEINADDKNGCRYNDHYDFFLLPQRLFFLKNVRRTSRAALFTVAVIIWHGRLRHR